MPDAEYTVTIEQARDEVFEALAAGERCAEWRPGVLEIRKQSGQGRGAIYEQWVKGPGGRRVAADYQITEYRPNTFISFEGIAGPVRPEGSYTLEELDGKTQVTFALSSRLGAFRKLFMGPMVNRTMQSEVRCLDNLKRILEAGPSPEPDSGQTEPSEGTAGLAE